MKHIIYLDAGHGSDTFEKTGGKGLKKQDGTLFEEHTFNANVVRFAIARLKRYDHFDVRLTQPLNEREVSLNKRKSTSLDGDLLLSIHANAGILKANGACSFFWYSSTAAKRVSDLFVKHFKETIVEVSLHGSGQHASMPNSWTNLFICRSIPYVSGLLEFGFFTNPDDLKHIESERYQKKCAYVIEKIVCEYFDIQLLPETKEKQNTLDSLTPKQKLALETFIESLQDQEAKP